MKKAHKSLWISLILAVMLVASLVTGCGNTDKQADQPKTTDQPQVAEKVTIEQLADRYYTEMPKHSYKIPLDELKSRVDANDSTMLVIDIRKAEDYAKNHIKGSVNIPMAEMGNYLDKLPGDKELEVYCYTGQTAGQTVAVLNIYGYKARSLHLGFDKGWVGTGKYPVDTTVVNLPSGVKPATPPSEEIGQLAKDFFNNWPDDRYILTVDKVKEMIDAKKDFQLVSIQKKEDFDKGHIAGSELMPFGEFNKHFNEVSKDKPVVVYCYTGQTAGQTVGILRLMGYDAYSLRSGFDLGWVPANLPVEVTK